MISGMRKIDPRTVDPSGRADINSELRQLKVPDISSLSSVRGATVGTTETYSGDPFGVVNSLQSRDDKLRFLFVGITGDLFPRFFGNAVETLLEALPDLLNRLEIVPVGRADSARGDRIVKDLRERFPNSPIADYLTTEQARDLLRTEELRVDGTYLATPPNQHLSGTIEYLDLTSGAIFCEKPLCMPTDLGDYDRVLERNRDRIVPIDCFTTAIPLFWLLNTEAGRELLHTFGSPVVFNGTVAESQEVEIQRLGGNLGLLRECISGGGIGLDCGVHSYAMARASFDSIGVDIGSPQRLLSAASYLDKPYLERKLDSDFQELGLFRETTGVAQLVSDGSVINAQGMKGVHATAYCLEMINQSGERIVISLGTDDKYPYLAYSRANGELELRTFSSGYRPDVGYTGTLYSMLSFMCNRDPNRIFPSLSAITNSTRGGVEIFGAMNQISPNDFVKYDLGSEPSISVPIPLDVDRLVPFK